jgi:hypothetical protein
LSGGWILELGFGNFFTQSRKEERKAATSIWILEFGFLEFPPFTIHASRLPTDD